LLREAATRQNASTTSAFWHERCTIFLSIRNVCIAPGATLLFHAGGSMRKGTINPSTTQQMLSTYNAALRQYVTDNHFMDTFAFYPISGSEIIKRFGYRACR
jgi:hypothetical protein